MTKKTDTPAIRFKGFSDTWEQRKAKDLCSISTGKSNTQDRVDDGIYPFYVRSPIVEHSNRYLFDEEAVLTVGDGVGTGKVFHYVNGKYDLHQRVYRMFDFSEEITAKYFYYYFSNHFYDRVMAMTAKTSVDSVRYEMIADMDIALPKVKEQMAISDYFERLDNLITLHQRKYEKLHNIKKSMLEKMFPKNGSNVPEIRFKGFTEAWEQRKLGDCFTERVESMPDGELISVTINDGIKKFSELGRHDNSNDDKSKYKKVCIGDIAYNSMRMWQGASGYSPYEGIVSPAYTVLSPNSGINSKCLAYQFKLPEMIHTFQINSQGITSDNWNLKYPALSEIEIFVSRNEKEQAKISEYFEGLDRLITLHQRELEKLQNIKKSMLEKMFV